MLHKFPTKYFPSPSIEYIHGMPARKWYQKEYVRLGEKRYKKKYLGYMKTKTPIRMGSRAFEAQKPGHHEI